MAETENSLINYLDMTSIYFKYHEFKKYINDTEESRLNAINMLKEKFNKTHQQWSIDGYVKMETNILYNFRASLIIQFFTFLDTELKKFCHLYAKSNSQIEKYSEYFNNKGENDFVTANKFLADVVGKDLRKGKDYNFLINLYQLRNQLVHSGLFINKTDSLKRFNTISNICKDNFKLTCIEEFPNWYEIELNEIDFSYKCLDKINQYLYSIVDIDPYI